MLAIHQGTSGTKAVVVDGDGTVLALAERAVRPVYSPGGAVEQDRRAESITRPLAAHAEELAQRTGLVPDPYFSAPKQAWIRRHLTPDGVVTTTDPITDARCLRRSKP